MTPPAPSSVRPAGREAPGGPDRRSSPTRAWPASCGRPDSATSRSSRPGPPPIRAGSGPPRPMTSGLPGSAGRRRSSTWPVARPGRVGGAGERSTMPRPRPSRGLPDPGRRSPGLGGRGRRDPALHLGRARSGRPAGCPPAGRPRDRARQPGRDLPADAARDGDRRPRPGPPGGRVHPIFSGYAAPAVAARLDAFAATHLITADGFLRRGASCRSRPWPTKRWPSPHRSAGSSSSGGWPARSRRSGPRCGLGRDGVGGVRRGAGGPGRSTSSRPPIPSSPTWSSTPRARPVGRRAPSTSTAASRSRPPRTWPTRSTCAPATPCAGSPTWAG